MSKKDKKDSPRETRDNNANLKPVDTPPEAQAETETEPETEEQTEVE